MGISLYRRYRPQKFRQIVSQDAAVDVLMHSILNSRIGHAYLFSGPRGCGKTSAARIVAKALNCLVPLNDERRCGGAEPCCECDNCAAVTAGESLDVVEIDGASNNSVDEVRELKSHVTLAPFSSKYKVYIIDEVHMLSAAAFNALLKTLEEPPSYVVFILATTEPHKVPVTIRSRCQHIPFRGIGTKQIFEHLTHVCAEENVTAQSEALWETARQADGAMRDALSLLEQIIGRASAHGGDVTLSDVEGALGTASRPALERWISGLHAADDGAERREILGASFIELKKMMDGGTSPQRIFEEMFSLMRNIWLMLRWPSAAGELDVSEQELSFLKGEAPRWSEAEIRRLLASVLKLVTQAKLGARADVLTGMLMMDLAEIASPMPNVRSDVSAESVGARLPAAPERRSAEITQTVRRSGLSPEPAVPANIPISMPKHVPSHDDIPPEMPRAFSEALHDGRDAPQLPEIPLSVAPENPCSGFDWQEISAEDASGILNRIHDGDFVLYSAMFDARFSSAAQITGGGALLIDVGDRYCFEALKTSRCRSSVARIFSDMRGGVLTKFNGESFVCFGGGNSDDAESSPARTDEPERSSRRRGEPVRPEKQRSGPPRGFSVDEARDDGYVPPDFIPPDMPNPATGHGDAQPAHSFGSSMPFEGLVRDVSRLMNGTVVMVKHDASESDIRAEDEDDE